MKGVPKEVARAIEKEKKEYYCYRWYSCISISLCLIVVIINYLPLLNVLTFIDKYETVTKLKNCLNNGSITVDMNELVIPSGYCNNESFKTLDLRLFKSLRRIWVNEGSLMYVKMVRIVGLNELENITIGNSCFTLNRNYVVKDSQRRFYMTDCAKLKQLVVGDSSFSDYSVCAISNDPSLETIEFGSLNSKV